MSNSIDNLPEAEKAKLIQTLRLFDATKNGIMEKTEFQKIVVTLETERRESQAKKGTLCTMIPRLEALTPEAEQIIHHAVTLDTRFYYRDLLTSNLFKEAFPKGRESVSDQDLKPSINSSIQKITPCVGRWI